MVAFFSAVFDIEQLMLNEKLVIYAISHFSQD